MPFCGSFLFGNGGAYAIDERKEEGEVDGARYLGSVFEVEGSELGDDSFDGFIWRQQPYLRLVCHDGINRPRCSRRIVEKRGEVIAFEVGGLARHEQQCAGEMVEMKASARQLYNDAVA